MENVTALLTAIFAILTPIIVAVLSHLIAKVPKSGAKLAKTSCILASYITLFLVSSLIPQASNGLIRNQLFVISLPTGTINVGLYVDNLALLPAFISSLFTALALTYNVCYLSPNNRAYRVGREFNRSYSFILLFNGVMIGTLFSSSLLTLIIFWEMVSVCSYVLISFWNEDQFSLFAGLKSFIMTHMGSTALMIATIIIYSATGTLDISEIGQRIPLGASTILAVFPLLLIAVLPKTVLFPLHTWLPDGTVAPTSATVLFHVCGFQSGIYIIARFFLDTFRTHLILAPTMPLSLLFGNVSVWSFIISFVGAITLIIGALNGIIENDFKRIVAYSTISQLGYIVMAAGLTTSLGVMASLFHMISHALYCGLLFLCAGAVIYATGKHNINEVGGLYRYMPITTACCLIGILSLSSVPLLSDFASKYLIFSATIDAGAPVFGIIAFLGCLLNVAIAIRLFHSVFMQRTVELSRFSMIKDPPAYMLGPMILASAALIVFGVAPFIPLNLLVAPAVKQIGFQTDFVIKSELISTPLGFWNPAAIAISIFTISIIFVFMILYSKKTTLAYRKTINEEKFKPFLCGEDLNILDNPRGYHFYFALTNVLKVDQVCHATNVDRAYNKLSTKFFDFCEKTLHMDIRQSYFPAVLSFTIGAILVILITIFGG